MLEDMQLRGLAQGTQATYVRSICRLAHYYHKSPDLITEQELRDYVMELNAGKLVKRICYTNARDYLQLELD